MNALILTLFVGTMLLLISMVSFYGAAKRKDHEHADRLALLPLLGDDVTAIPRTPSAPQ